MNELFAFNIEVIHEEPQQFFGCPLPEGLNISPTILDNLDEPQDATQVETEFFMYLEDASHIPPGEESCVVDFAVVLLKLMGYNEQRHIIHTRQDISFEMCGEYVSVKTDVCVMEHRGAAHLLLVQEDKVSNA